MTKRSKSKSRQAARPGPSLIVKPIVAKAAGNQQPWAKISLLDRWSNLRSYLLLSAATLLCLLPFSGRAFHVDDPLFIWAAQQIVKHPLDPYGFRLTWDNTQVSMADVTQNPPLASYYAALIGRVAGWSERALHLGFLAPTLALVLGTYRLAQRFTGSPVLAGLATLLAPGLLVSASGVMCDTMMLAIWVWAAIFWIEGLEPAKPLLLSAAAVLVAASALTKYFGAALILLLFAYSIVRLRRVGSWALYLLLPVVILFAYQLWTAQLYGHGLLLGAAAFAGSQRAYANASPIAMALVGISFVGGCALPSLISAPLIWSWKEILAGVAVSAFAATSIILGWVSLGLQVGGDPVLVARREHWLLLTSQLTLCIAGGLAVLALAIADYWKEKSADSLFLTLWVAGTFVFAAFVNYTVNARSVLPLIPAAGILLARRFDGIPGQRSAAIAMKFAGVLLLSAFISVWVTAADAELADSARQAAILVHERTHQQPGTVWFEGHWGFQYYMQSLGAQPLDLLAPQVQMGDFVVIPRNNIQLQDIAPQFIASSETVTSRLHSWASTICRDLGAGFYSSNWGPLPFVFGPIPAESYAVLRIARKP